MSHIMISSSREFCRHVECWTDVAHVGLVVCLQDVQMMCCTLPGPLSSQVISKFQDYPLSTHIDIFRDAISTTIRYLGM